MEPSLKGRISIATELSRRVHVQNHLEATDHKQSYVKAELFPGAIWLQREGTRAAFLTNDANAFIPFRKFDHILWVNLIFLEDDKNRGILNRIHTAVKPRRWFLEMHISFRVISNQDTGHNHNTELGGAHAFPIAMGGIFCEVTSHSVVGADMSRRGAVEIVRTDRRQLAARDYTE